MKTKLFAVVLLLVIAVSVKAQKKDEKAFKFGAGVVIGLPVGEYTSFTSLAYGIDVMGEYAIAPSVALTLSAGYLDWVKKSGYSGNSGMIPVLAGLKYDFSDKIYGSFQAGVTFSTSSQYNGTAFTFAPGVGYKISEKFDLLLKYQSASKNGANAEFLGLRAGYTF